MDVIMTAPRLAPEAVAVIEAAGGRLHYMRPYPSAAEIAALAAALNPVAILSRQGPVTAAAMDAAPALRIVARHGVGVEDVDIGAAAARGITVARAPGSNTRAVAEHTMAVMLALVKELGPLSRHVGGGGWREAGTKVRDVAGLRLGLLGFGAIGQAVARLAGAFGMGGVGVRPGDAGGGGGDWARGDGGVVAGVGRAVVAPAVYAIDPACRGCGGAGGVAGGGVCGEHGAGRADR